MSAVTYQILARPKRMLQVDPFEARQIELKGGRKADRAYYHYTFILDPSDPDTAAMINIAKDLIDGAGRNRKVDLNKLQAGRDYNWPFQKGDDVAAKADQKLAAQGRTRSFDRPYAGKILLNANTPSDSPVPTTLIIPVNGKYEEVDPAAAKASRLFYRGMNALGTVAFMAFDMGQIWGVTAMVNELVATGTGERFGGQTDVAKYGKPEVSGTTTNFDPTASQPSW